jgi:hypothetical protein
MHKQLMVSAVALLNALMLTAPADAKPIERGTINDTYDLVHDDFCGVPGLTVSDRGRVQIRFRINTHGRSQLPYYAENVREDGTVTSPTTGRTITYSIVTNGKDLHVADNRDGTVTIIGFATGNYTVWGDEGRALGRNPGQFRDKVLIDRNGTPFDFSDDEFLGQLEVIKPSTGRSDDICQAMLSGLGVIAP